MTSHSFILVCRHEFWVTHGLWARLQSEHVLYTKICQARQQHGGTSRWGMLHVSKKVLIGISLFFWETAVCSVVPACQLSPNVESWKISDPGQVMNFTASQGRLSVKLPGPTAFEASWTRFFKCTSFSSSVFVTSSSFLSVYLSRASRQRPVLVCQVSFLCQIPPNVSLCSCW